MSSLLSISEIIEIGKVSTYLSANYTSKQGLFGGNLIKPIPPVQIAFVTDAVEWGNESQGAISEVNAIGSITITDIGNDGDTIEVFVNDPVYGNISLGSYTKLSSDTTTTILASSITTALSSNTYGYGVSSLNSVITITARNSLGASINGNNNLSATITAFSPSDLSDLWAWYDANIGVTGTTSVTAWADQSGNSRNLSASAGEEPALVTNAINSLPAISSYGLLAKMSTSGNIANMSTGGTIFLVAKQSENNGASNFDSQGVFIGAGSQVNMQIQRGNTSSGSLFSIFGGINTSTRAISGNVVLEDTFVSIRLRYNGTTNYISINNNTEDSSISNGSGYSGTPLTIFKTIGGPQGNKQIAEILIYNRQLTTEEINNIQTYLNNKYNLY